MAKRIDINWANIEAMYIWSEKKMSIADLVVSCKKQGIQVSQGSIGNRASEGKWVEKRNAYWLKINKNVAKRITSQITQRRLDNIKIVNAAVKLGANNLLNKLKDDKNFTLSAGDLDKLMRLEEFLLGYSDSRSEKRIILDKPLTEMTDKELLEAKDKILDATFEIIGEDDGS